MSVRLVSSTPAPVKPPRTAVDVIHEELGALYGEDVVTEEDAYQIEQALRRYYAAHPVSATLPEK